MRFDVQAAPASHLNACSADFPSTMTSQPSGTDARTQALRQTDSRVVWHPFTAMEAYAEERAPIIERAEGFELIDTAGRRYLDGHSSLWCNLHGHRVPEIDAALRAQLDRMAHSTLLGLGNVPSIELAAELVERVPPGLNHVFYTDCGAAGVEAALKIAWQYHRQKSSGSQERDLFAGLTAAYHGDTVGTISLGGIDRFHSLFGGMMFPALRIPSPATVGLAYDDCQQQTTAILEQHADRIAGVVIEPLVQAAAGILVHPPGHLRWLRDLTIRLGLLLIADEIAVGFGRLGTITACEQEGVTPDILILSKGLTGGYLPLAATLVTSEIYEAFLGPPSAGRTFFHGHTYTGNPLACVAALASLRRIDSHDVLVNARRIEALLKERLPQLSTRHRGVSAVRHRGTMVGLDLCSPQTGQKFPVEARMGHQITLACRERGVILRNIGDTLVLMPAPAMPVDLVNRLVDVVDEALEVVEKVAKGLETRD